MYGTELHAEQKPVEEKILQVLQVLKNTEVKGKIKTKTVSEPVAFQGQDSAFTHIFMQQRYADSGQTLLIELQNYEQQGISIWLEGFPSSSVEVSEVMCVREDTNYMRDYVFRQGALSQVRFDKITKK